jgi:hypothetical protein
MKEEELLWERRTQDNERNSEAEKEQNRSKK